MGVKIGRNGKAVHIEGPGEGGDATLCGMGADYIKGTDAPEDCKKCLAKAAKLRVEAEMAQEAEASVERNRRIVARATAETLDVQTEELAPVATCDMCGKVATLHVLYNDGREGYLCEDVVSECRADMSDDLFFVDTINDRGEWGFYRRELAAKLAQEAREALCGDSGKLAKDGRAYCTCGSIANPAGFCCDTGVKISEEGARFRAVITHNCATCGPRTAAQCGWCYAAYPDGSRMIPMSELMEHSWTLMSEVRQGDIVGDLDAAPESLWSVGSATLDGGRVHLVAWDGTDRGNWAAGDFVTVLRRTVCQHLIASRRFKYTASERVVWCDGCGKELVRERIAPRFTTYGRKRKGCKVSRQRSNSRIGRGVRA